MAVPAGVAALLAWANAAAAASAIRGDKAPGVSMGTQVSFSGATYTIDGGKRVGDNLFQSFSSFSLAAGDTADWVYTAGDAATILNVINRVTGGAPSRIDGTIDTQALPRASFYFINPAGVVFGAAASLDVPGAVYISTASVLRFADGASFSAATPKGSVLTVAAPNSFGFLGGEGGLSVDGVGAAFISASHTLSLSGADVKISAAAFKTAALDLVAVGDQALDLPVSGLLPKGARLTGDLSIVDGSALTTRPTKSATGAIQLGGGDVTLNDSKVVTEAGLTVPGGDLTMTAQALRVTDGGSAGATTSSAQTAGDVTVTAGTVLIDGAGAAPNHSFIASYTTGAGDAGQVIMTVSGNLAVRNGADLSVGNASTGTGAAGAITINSGSLVIDGGTSSPGQTAIAANTFNSGDGGDVKIDVPGILTIENGGAISTQTLGAGNAGSVTLVAGKLTVSSGGFIEADTFASGNGGDVNVTAGSAVIDGGYVSASSGYTKSAFIGAGNAGDVTINIDSALDVKNGGYINSDADDITGAAGKVTVNAGSLLIDGGAGASNTFIRADSFGSGNAGDVAVTVTGNMSIRTGGYLESSAAFDSTGAAGDVTVNAGSLQMDGGAGASNTFIRADSFGSGHAGDVAVTVTNQLTLRNGVAIESAAAGSIGAGGDVTVNAGSLLSDGGVNGISSIDTNTYSTGNAGDVHVNVIGSLILNKNSSISSNTYGIGNAGKVFVSAESLLIDGGAADTSYISSDSTSNSIGDVGSGNAGAVNVMVAGKLILRNGAYISSEADDASGASGNVTVNVGSLMIDGGVNGISYIDTDTYSTGNAGDVHVNVTGGLILNNSSGISSDTYGTGNAGKVFVSARSLLIDGGAADNSYISSSSVSDLIGDVGSGNAGDVNVMVAGQLTLRNGAYISSEADDASGASGNVTVNAGSLLSDGGVNGASGIDTDTYSTGTAGDVNVNVIGSLILNNSSYISSDTLGIGNAGKVFVSAGSLLVDGGAAHNSYISSSSTNDGMSGDVGAGNAGAVNVKVAGQLTLRSGGAISSSANDMIGDAGDTYVSAGQLIIVGAPNDFTGISSQTHGSGAGGEVDVTAPAINVRSGGGLSTSAFGSGNAGSVVVNGGSGAVTLSSGGTIASNADAGSTGAPGDVDVLGATLLVESGGLIETNSANGKTAGEVTLDVPKITISGVSSEISSVNSSEDGGQAGDIRIVTDPILLANGGAISTNAASGPAGDILLTFEQGGVLSLTGTTSPGSITTTSGANSGGEITIATPTLILMNGGLIQALGPGNAALVHIDAGSIIQSSDHVNTIAVAGTVQLNSQVVDIDKSVTDVSAGFIDASRVLSGQCASRRAEGRTSALGTRATGPYGADGLNPHAKLADVVAPSACRRQGA